MSVFTDSATSACEATRNMRAIQLYVEFLEGEVPPDVDLHEFDTQIRDILDSYEDKFEAKVTVEKTPAPKGALGVDQFLLYVIENFDQISDYVKNTTIYIKFASSLVELYLKTKKKTSESEKDRTPVAEIKIGEAALRLPASQKEIDEFIKANVKSDEGQKNG